MRLLLLDFPGNPGPNGTPGRERIQAIKAIRAATGLGLREAKAATDHVMASTAPYVLREGLTAREATYAQGALMLEGLKVQVDIETHGNTVAALLEQIQGHDDQVEGIRRLLGMR